MDRKDDREEYIKPEVTEHENLNDVTKGSPGQS